MAWPGQETETVKESETERDGEMVTKRDGERGTQRCRDGSQRQEEIQDTRETVTEKQPKRQ